MHNNQATVQSESIEFIAIMALLMSLVALSIDAILPALAQIGSSYGIDSQNSNETQLLLSTIFLGMAFGLMIYGPLSDAYGRKSIVYLGVSIFLVGSIVSLFSSSFDGMLMGRFIQGFGAASCRVVSLAMIRDRFSGNEMGKVMSLITAIFIIVPAIAPSIGQLILMVADWQAIFSFVMLVSIISVLWLHFRQTETLLLNARREFSMAAIKLAILETVKTPVSLGYMVAAGLIFGSFIGYLSTAQQILQIQYQLGNSFSLVFGLLSLSVGISSFFNSKLLIRFSMERLCFIALTVMTCVSLIFLLYTLFLAQQPQFGYTFAYLFVVFYCFGILFGNFNALAMRPLGHIAGTASSTIASLQMVISTSVGVTIGYFYDNSVLPLIIGFMLTGFVSLLICIVLKKKSLISQ